MSAISEEQLLERLSVKDAMRRQFSRLYPKDDMARAFQLLRQDKEHNFLVFDRWQNLQAVLSEETILKTAKNNRLDHKVEQWAGKEYDYVFEDESMKAAMLRMQKSGQSVLPVCNRYGRLTGLIDRMGVDHALRLQRQLKS